ncbi:DUF2835 family protein [Ferrimonas pelagia]|uniref:DUF2835 family protein n=1 Tax=Ferrimonas pelagia TaxID=1177826 RepID=A0ABP9F9W7_9GAMM
MQSHRFFLNIGWQEMQRYYRGQADRVVCRSTQGKVLHIHPRFFRPFLRSEGVRGWFTLTLAADGSLLSLERGA